MRMKTCHLLHKTLYILECCWASIVLNDLPHDLIITFYARWKPKSGTAKVVDDKTSPMLNGTPSEGVGKVMKYCKERLGARK